MEYKKTNDRFVTRKPAPKEAAHVSAEFRPTLTHDGGFQNDLRADVMKVAEEYNILKEAANDKDVMEFFEKNASSFYMAGRLLALDALTKQITGHGLSIKEQK